METPAADETIVMTATFNPGSTPFLVVRDEQERIFQYLCSLAAWARPSRVRRLVLGENSNTTFDFSPVIRLFEAAGKELELIVFDGNQEASRVGKGYGEGRILERVFRNSTLLRSTPSFYKITGRLFVSNFDDVSQSTPTADGFRRKRWKDPARPPKVITRFFKCSKELFERRLLDAYLEADDSRGRHIEHIYFDRLAEIDVPDFGVKPALVGQQASTGEVYGAYDDEIVRVARSLLSA